MVVFNARAVPHARAMPEGRVLCRCTGATCRDERTVRLRQVLQRAMQAMRGGLTGRIEQARKIAIAGRAPQLRRVGYGAAHGE
jgi:hypothetical protein